MSDESILEAEAIKELREVAGDQLGTVLQDYVNNGRVHEQRLVTASAQHQWDKVASVAHDIKGSYGYVGATRLVQLCMQVLKTVRADKAGDEQLVALAQDLLAEFRRVRQALETLIRQ